MSKAALPWTSDDKPIDYEVLSIDALLVLWREHRNDPTGLMAADEVCRRLLEERNARR